MEEEITATAFDDDEVADVALDTLAPCPPDPPPLAEEFARQFDGKEDEIVSFICVSMEAPVGGVEGRVSCRIFWMTRALVRTGPERIGAKVTEPKSSSPDSGRRSSSLKLFEVVVVEVPLRRSRLELLVVGGVSGSESRLVIPGRSSTRTIGCSESLLGDR